MYDLDPNRKPDHTFEFTMGIAIFMAVLAAVISLMNACGIS